MAVAVELASFAAGLFMTARGLFYRAPATVAFDEFMKLRDPTLGWGAPHGSDAAGSRIVPAFPAPHARVCVSLYGDSFTIFTTARGVLNGSPPPPTSLAIRSPIVPFLDLT